MIKLLKIFFILLCIYSCSTDPTPLEYSPPISSSIFGEWEWTRSESAWTGEITTPEDVGYNEIKEFGKDNTLRIIRNNVLDAEYKYSVIYIDSTETQSRGTLIIVQGSQPSFTIENSTFILSEAYVDGPISYHKRIK